MPDIEIADSNQARYKPSPLDAKLLPVPAVNPRDNMIGSEDVNDDSGSEEEVKDPVTGVKKIRKRDKLKGLFSKVKNGVKATGSGIRDRLKSP